MKYFGNNFCRLLLPLQGSDVWGDAIPRRWMTWAFRNHLGDGITRGQQRSSNTNAVGWPIRRAAGHCGKRRRNFCIILCFQIMWKRHQKCSKCGKPHCRLSRQRHAMRSTFEAFLVGIFDGDRYYEIVPYINALRRPNKGDLKRTCCERVSPSIPTPWDVRIMSNNSKTSWFCLRFGDLVIVNGLCSMGHVLLGWIAGIWRYWTPEGSAKEFKVYIRNVGDDLRDKSFSFSKGSAIEDTRFT